MRPLSEKGPADKVGENRHAIRQLQRRPAPVVDPGGAADFPWAMIIDGFVGTNSGTTYSIGGQSYGTNDVVQDYYTFDTGNATYPVFGSTDYYRLNVVQRGFYLLDAQLTIASWSVTNCYAEFDLNPNKEAWYPFGFGTNEDDAWIDRHVTHDATNGQVASFFRVCGVASLDSSTEFFPSFRQVSGTNSLVASFNYLKIVRLKDYEAIGDIETATI